MNKLRIRWFLVGSLLVIILVAGVPIIINECYRVNTGYITVWNAADLLSYYGTIIAAGIGIVGVYLTVYIANKNYRDDARNRILPYIAINVINVRQPKSLSEGENYASFGNDPIIEDSLTGKAQNHLFFVIDGAGKIRATEALNGDEAKSAKGTEALWIRAAKDGKMYLRGAERISMPFTIENIGNGPAKKLRVSFASATGKHFFKTEMILRQRERFYIHIFSEKAFEKIKGEYVFIVCYEDIAGNTYTQQFPVEIVQEDGRRYDRIDTNGVQEIHNQK